MSIPVNRYHATGFLPRISAKSNPMRLRDYFFGRGRRDAKELLLQSRLPMIEIALKCGFADRACLMRRFHKLLNTTPGEWRKKRGNSGAACNFARRNGSNDR